MGMGGVAVPAAEEKGGVGGKCIVYSVCGVAWFGVVLFYVIADWQGHSLCLCMIVSQS